MTSDIKAFEQWASQQGITSRGVKPKRFATHGLGLTATRDLEPDQTVVEVPTSSILSLDSIPVDFKSKFVLPTTSSSEISTATTHAIIAAYLAFHQSSPIALGREPHPWTVLWPLPADFAENLSMIWPEWFRNLYCPKCRDFKMRSPSCSHLEERMVKLLPPTVEKMNAKQREKFNKDFTDVAKSGVTERYVQQLASDEMDAGTQVVLPLDPLIRFVYCWAVVNTRCFYYILPSLSTGADESTMSDAPVSTSSTHFPNSDDNMALLPYLDLFNHISTPPLSSEHHSDYPHPCKVSFSPSSYMFTTPCSPPSSVQASGSEIYVSYGAHSQDFLFAEYGFILPPHSNNDDFLELDPIILSRLTPSQKGELEKAGWSGDYSLYPENDSMRRKEAEVCFRTQVVAIMLAATTMSSSASTSSEAQARQSKKRKAEDSSTNATNGKQIDEDEEVSPWLLYAGGSLDLDLDDHTNAEIRESGNGQILSFIQSYLNLAQKALAVLDEIEGDAAMSRKVLGNGARKVKPTWELGESEEHVEREMTEEEYKIDVKCAKTRYKMLRGRWEEIKEICERSTKRKDWF